MKQSLGLVSLVVRTTMRRLRFLLANSDLILSKTPSFPISPSAGSWSLRPGQLNRGYCSLKRLPLSKPLASAHKPEGASSCSSIPTTCGATTNAIGKEGSSLFELRRKSPMGPWPFSKISMATCGICCNRRIGNVVESLASRSSFTAQPKAAAPSAGR